MIDFNYTVLIQFANFLILLIILNFLLFKPVLKALGKREQAVDSLNQSARSTEGDIGNLEKSYEETVKEKKRPIIEKKDATLAEARQASTQMLSKARTDLAEELARLRADIESDSKKAYDALMTDVDRLSRNAAEKILKRSL